MQIDTISSMRSDLKVANFLQIDVSWIIFG